MSKRQKSPCIDVCKYNGPKGWCVACGLTSKESKGWKAMKPYGRTLLLKQLQGRQSEMKALDLGS